MSLTLYYHPMSSYCWKALIALHENETPFERIEVDLSDERQRAALAAAWPMERFPVLRDDIRGVALPEAAVIVEYLGLHYPGPGFTPIPGDPDQAMEVRLMDRLFDNDVMNRMQAVVFDRLRPEQERDPFGVAAAHAGLAKAYGVIDARIAGRRWAAGDDFTLADCAAFPALFYAGKVEPFRDRHAALSAYMDRLEARPSIQRVLADAAPYLALFPT